MPIQHDIHASLVSCVTEPFGLSIITTCTHHAYPFTNGGRTCTDDLTHSTSFTVYFQVNCKRNI